VAPFNSATIWRASSTDARQCTTTFAPAACSRRAMAAPAVAHRPSPDTASAGQRRSGKNLRHVSNVPAAFSCRPRGHDTEFPGDTRGCLNRDGRAVTSAELPVLTPDEAAHSARLIATRPRGHRCRRRLDRLCPVHGARAVRPRLGYYSAGARKFGAEGDFVTAPEVAPVFSRCLAVQVAEILASSDRRPSCWSPAPGPV
jgi:hypothetical protein